MSRSCATMSFGRLRIGVPVSASRRPSSATLSASAIAAFVRLRARILAVVRLVEDGRPQPARREPLGMGLEDVVVAQHDVGASGAATSAVPTQARRRGRAGRRRCGPAASARTRAARRASCSRGRRRPPGTPRRPAAPRAPRSSCPDPARRRGTCAAAPGRSAPRHAETAAARRRARRRAARRRARATARSSPRRAPARPRARRSGAPRRRSSRPPDAPRSSSRSSSGERGVGGHREHLGLDRERALLVPLEGDDGLG